MGRQLLMMLLESADDRYAWLNNTVCICEGAFDPYRRWRAHQRVRMHERALGQAPNPWVVTVFSARLSTSLPIARVV